MKFVIASDIHGSARWCRALMDLVDREKPDKLILLGDLLYHGPRNDLPADYNPKAVITLLNNMKEELLCVRGNCEAEVDQMVLDFPVLADYMVLWLEGHMIFVTHGHTWNTKNLPPLKKGDILLHGHTHIPVVEPVEEKGIVYLNPGSLSIPKNNSPHSYMIYEDGVFETKDLEGNTFLSYKLK